MYLENVYALLGKKGNMRAVLLYILEDRVPVGRLGVYKPCDFGRSQECEKRGLVLSWSCVALEHVGLPAASSKNSSCLFFIFFYVSISSILGGPEAPRLFFCWSEGRTTVPGRWVARGPCS